jgi:hypothetical protein
VRQTETALRIDALLSSPQSAVPSGATTLTDKREKKFLAKSAQGSPS